MDTFYMVLFAVIAFCFLLVLSLIFELLMKIYKLRNEKLVLQRQLVDAQNGNYAFIFAELSEAEAMTLRRHIFTEANYAFSFLPHTHNLFNVQANCI